MVALSLKISIGNVVKTMQFEPSTMVYDACRMIRERVPEAQMGQRKCAVWGSAPALCKACFCFPSCTSFFLFWQPWNCPRCFSPAWGGQPLSTRNFSTLLQLWTSASYLRLCSMACCCSAACISKIYI